MFKPRKGGGMRSKASPKERGGEAAVLAPRNKK